MPNWCDNVINLSHPDKAMIDKIVDAVDNDKGVLSTLIPCPEDLQITAGSFSDPVKQAELEAAEERNLGLHGYKNWYDWQVANWGTKWDLSEPSVTRHDDNTITINCQTAWSPPVAAFDSLQAQGFYVEGFYYEPGMAYVGHWEDGNDACVEYSGETSTSVRSVVGDELDDMFNISESIAEYEAENAEEEELTEWIREGVQATTPTVKDSSEA